MHPRPESHLELGVLGRPHGIGGELKVRLHHSESTALSEVDELIVVKAGAPAKRLSVLSLRGSAKGPIIRFAGVGERSAAEALVGAVLWVERSEVAPLEAGEYYLVDLIGCEVFLYGRPFAKVTGVRPDPSVDTMQLLLSDGRKAEMPINEAWVGKVDVQEQRVEILSDDGIIV